MEEKKFFIPKMGKTEIVKWYQNISPIVKKDGKSVYLRRLTDDEVTKYSYTWLNDAKDYGDEVDYAKLEQITELNMLHTYGYYGLFKPTVGEVIRQIPQHLLSEVVAFEIVSHPTCIADLNLVREITNAGFHRSTVRLYRTAN